MGLCILSTLAFSNEIAFIEGVDGVTRRVVINNNGDIVKTFGYKFDNTMWKMIKKHEGPYSNKNADSGGRTIWGISCKKNPKARICKEHYRVMALKKWKLSNKTVAKIYLQDEAKAFYKGWWNKYKFNKLTNPKIARFLFDQFLPNKHGALQVAHRAVGYGNGKHLDQRLINKLNRMDTRTFFVNYKIAMMKRYVNIAPKGKNIKHFRGWVRRIASQGPGKSDYRLKKIAIITKKKGSPWYQRKQVKRVLGMR